MLRETFRRFYHVLGVDPALFHHFRTGCAQPELMEPNHFPIETNILIPNLSDSGVDRDPFPAFVRQDLFTVFLRLPIETFEARHGDDARAVSELLRRRERELMTKDATIREIHHRVKNNLQTVAALLRLQARRLRAPEARAALDEAVRRVGSIAVVHETLSHAPEEAVDFDDIADRVARMAAEVSAAEVGVIPKITGSFGQLSAAVATPLAMVLAELLQNALQHGFSGSQAAREPGLIEVVVVREPERLTVTVADTGVGLPEGFELDSATSLGLQIVRTLVVGELGGRLRITPRPGGGTEALVDLPIGNEPDRETVT